MRAGFPAGISRLLAPRRACALGLVLALAGCGHLIGPGLDLQGGADRFDFADPPCTPEARPAWREDPDQVILRYLGAGGLYVGWHGQAILTGPFFTDPGFLDLLLSPITWDTGAIFRGLDGVPLGRVGAILVGHSHYDHLGDLPVVAGQLADWTALYVNRSGANALEAYPGLRRRVRVLEELEGRWAQVTDAAGHRLPFRFMAVPSDHAPHVLGIELMKGTNRPGRRPWIDRRYTSLLLGRPYALVVDLLASTDPGAPVRFRIYYQDAASKAGAGEPPEFTGADRHPYDLAVLCMASAQEVRPYPRGVLLATRPRHVLVGHWEDFFRPWRPARRFVPLLTDRRAARFLRTVDEAEAGWSATLRPPVEREAVCSPSTPGWTMPMPGQWLRFRPEG